jgi:hypothetical protein
MKAGAVACEIAPLRWSMSPTTAMCVHARFGAVVEFDPRFEIMPGTKARGTEATISDVHYIDPYEAVPQRAIAE